MQKSVNQNCLSNVMGTKDKKLTVYVEMNNFLFWSGLMMYKKVFYVLKFEA